MGLIDALRSLPWFLYLSVGLLGLCVGSFLNVVIYRLPKMMEAQWRAECAALAGEAPGEAETFNLVHPRSRCPACAAPITAWQNVPVASWLDVWSDERTSQTIGASMTSSTAYVSAFSDQSTVRRLTSSAPGGCGGT